MEKDTKAVLEENRQMKADIKDVTERLKPLIELVNSMNFQDEKSLLLKLPRLIKKLRNSPEILDPLPEIETILKKYENA